MLIELERPRRESESSVRVLCSFQDKNLADPLRRRGRRIHGLHLPLHPLQVTGWISLLIFTLATFLVVVPALKPPLRHYIFVLLAGLFLVHIAAHLTALLLDPADKELRRKHRSDRIIPEFDRTKHRHVIENSRCHLCNIQTSGPGTKHCSVCNKCVGNFDHHCRWLNHCIGSRNYNAFLTCVFTAVIATSTISGLVVTEISLYFVRPEALNLVWTAGGDSGGAIDTITTTAVIVNGSMLKGDATNDSLLVVPQLVDNITNSSADGSGIREYPLEDTLFLGFISVIGLLAAITAALLIHLCFFHIYISFLGLTTYEYIRSQRQQAAAAANASAAPTTATGQRSRPEEASNAEDIERRPRVNATDQRPSQENGHSHKTTKHKRILLSRSLSIDRMLFCSSVKSTAISVKSSKTKAKSLKRHFVDNKVDAITSVREGTANADVEEGVVEHSNGHLSTTRTTTRITTSALKTQCVLCSLIELDHRSSTKDFLCCTKIYGQEQVDIKLGLDVDPEEIPTPSLRVQPVHPSSKSPPSNQWRSKLYCCVAGVPDSPDAHLDVCHALNNLGQPNQGNVLRQNLGQTPPTNIFKITLTDDPDKRRVGGGGVTLALPPPPPPPLRPSRRSPVGKYSRLRRLLRMVKSQRSAAATAHDGLLGSITRGVLYQRIYIIGINRDFIVTITCCTNKETRYFILLRVLLALNNGSP